MPTISSFVRALAQSDRPAYRFEDRTYSWRHSVQAAADRAAYLLANRHDGPFHVGVLLENTPEFAFWLQAAALAGATIVGINPTRRGAELARDIEFTDCQFLITDAERRPILDELALSMPIVEVGDDHAPVEPSAPLPGVEVSESDLFLLLFTSGTTGAPKAVRCTQGRLAGIAVNGNRIYNLTADTTAYCSMPMFHSNALMACWAPALGVGATVALRRRFSASTFIDDVRRFGATYANYVGKPLAYILATPERADDRDNPLRLMFGNEASHGDIDRFAERFDCAVRDGYGSTEGGVNLSRMSGMPAGALGIADENVAVLDPETSQPRPFARFDEAGRLLNAEECLGEIVSFTGAKGFEGYYRNTEANEAKTRGGIYWSGDLGYMDESRLVYFGGRDYEWIRVDGENFAAAPVERIMARYPGVVLAAAYGVPNEIVGDDVMVALQLAPGATFDGEHFGAFLAEQSDLGTKWAPRYIRISAELPVTATSKVLKRQLRTERWEASDEVWWQSERHAAYRRLNANDVRAIQSSFESRGRLNALV
jgi:fatty-acyl-CoA synthase